MHIRKFAPTIPILLFSTLAMAQSGLPESHSCRLYSEWLAAFNSEGIAEFTRFIEENFPSRIPTLGRTYTFRKLTGGLEFYKAEESSDTHCIGKMKDRGADQFRSFDMEVEAEPAHKITKLTLQAISRPPELPSLRMADREMINALREKIDAYTSTDSFSGAVLVAKNGKTIFQRAYGMADRERNIANSLDTRFRMGSMNKMFTAVAILQLVQAGKIDLNAPFGKYVGDYPNKEVAGKVTIHHLLTHTGGMGDIFGPSFDERRMSLRTLQDYVNLYGRRPLISELGTHSYSNYGFLMLGVVIERVSGQSYYDYVRQHIYKPVRMNSSGSQPEEENVPHRANGYVRSSDDAPWSKEVDSLPWRGISAGGGYSTVGDLLRFANALRSHKLLNEHYTQLLVTGKVKMSEQDQYAYGFIDHTADGMRAVGHPGGAPGMFGSLNIYPDSGDVIVVLANAFMPSAERLPQFIEARLSTD